HFNLTIQREIAKSAVLSIGYVGSRGRHLLSTVESNPGDPAKCLATPGCDTFGEDTIYDLGGGNFVFGTRPFSVTSGRELDKTTGIGSLDFQNNAWEATVANSNYNALQTSLEKKVGNLRFLTAYTCPTTTASRSISSTRERRGTCSLIPLPSLRKSWAAWETQSAAFFMDRGSTIGILDFTRTPELEKGPPWNFVQNSSTFSIMLSS